MHEGHRQRMKEQLKTSGMDSLSDVQVLEVLLYYAIPRADPNPVAHRLLERFGSLSAVMRPPWALMIFRTRYSPRPTPVLSIPRDRSVL